MKKLSFSMRSGNKNPDVVEVTDESILFYVNDDIAQAEASRALSKVKIPATPSLHGLKKAYLFGDILRRKLSKSEIQIVQKKNLTKEEAYQLNVKVFDHLIEQRNAIVGVIGKMVLPLIGDVAGLTIRIGGHSERIAILERQVEELQSALKQVFGKTPIVPPLPGGKMPWSGPIKEAAILIIKNYSEDSKAEVRHYRHLRDASDEFFDQHRFIYKPDLTKDMLYENVKKANAL